ncbi:MAG: reverse transcriptase N-terminal domain-containing protein [Hassallia sp. WJT32-NPBG1]|jgi:RNA-directed DNA polymerase|nr:reverse transcriptase N-terminal domain-containing protein [Hassallia sp. WJT32-NPBG1]
MNKSKTRQFTPPTKKEELPLKDKPTRKDDSDESMVEWKHINWRKLERRVFKLQKRIYKASARGDVKTVRRLQKTLMQSWSAKCLAVRRVTQDNQGKKTAGIDGIKSLTPIQRHELVTKLRLNSKARPTRRVWIPKPGTEEKRPLGIPTVCSYCTSIQRSLGIFCYH